MREWLERDIRKEEVREVVNSCKQDKTPRDLMVLFGFLPTVLEQGYIRGEEIITPSDKIRSSR